MKFCEKLSNLRKKNNMSQEQLADRLGVSRQAVSKWELGSTIPDMDKIMQLCKILNCSLEDIIDDGVVTGTNKNTTTNAINFNQYYKEVLDFITKTLNMFWSMTLLEKVKCILEMLFIILVIFIVWGIMGSIINSIFSNILSLFPRFMYSVIYDIFSFLYQIFGVIIGIILLIHIFKIRYLDYFITVEDNTASSRTKEIPIDEVEKDKIQEERKFIEKKKNKIIIRDPKHSTYGFFGGLAKIVVLFIKCLLIIFAVPCIFCFVGLSFALTFSCIYIQYGIFFLGIAICLLGCLVINYLVLKVAYNFIIEKKYSYQCIFILFIIGLTLSGIGGGISFCNYLTFDKIDSNTKLIKTTKNIAMSDDTVLNFIGHEYTSFVEDNSLNNIKIEIEHYDHLEPTLNSYYNYEDEDIYSDDEQTEKYLEYNLMLHSPSDLDDFVDNLNEVLTNIKNKKRMTDKEYEPYKVKITTNHENIKKLQENYNHIYR